MSEKIKILITDDGCGETLNIASVLRTNSFDVRICSRDGWDVLHQVETFGADVLICDVFMRHVDIIGIAQRLNKQMPQKHPIIFAVSAVDNPRLERALMTSGVEYYFLKPVDPITVLQRVRLLLNRKIIGVMPERKIQSETTMKNIDSVITDLLLGAGLSMRYTGFECLKEAIKLIISDSSFSKNITKRFYPELAKKFSTTVSAVERAMRVAIERAYYDNRSSFIRWFGNTDVRQTNMEVILRFADIAKREMAGETRREFGTCMIDGI